MKRGLKVLEQWCKDWGVEVNVEKSGVMHIKVDGVRRWGAVEARFGKKKKSIRMFGWEGLQAEGLNRLSISEVRQILRDVAWREAMDSWKEEAEVTRRWQKYRN